MIRVIIQFPPEKNLEPLNRAILYQDNDFQSPRYELQNIIIEAMHLIERPSLAHSQPIIIPPAREINSEDMLSLLSSKK